MGWLDKRRARARMQRMGDDDGATATPVHTSPITAEQGWPTSDHLAATALLEQPCDGCAHSAARVPFPGRPSGEIPCCFCVRNPELEADMAHHQRLGCIGAACQHPLHGFWGNGVRARKAPADNYITLDRFREVRRAARHS